MPVFDGYRAFAIFGIIIFHLLGMAPTPESWDGQYYRVLSAVMGQLVDVLFIVSGFVVFLPTAVLGRFGDPARYAARRAARLLPAYYLIMVLALLVLWGSLPTLQSIGLHAIGMQTLLSYFDGLGSIGFGVNGPVWTLTVEISFYIVLPFIAMAFYRHPRIGLAGGALIAILWTVTELNIGEVAGVFGVDLSEGLVARSGNALDSQLPFWAFSFALGMFGARAFATFHEADETGRDRMRRFATVVQVAGLIGLAAFTLFAYLDFDGSDPIQAAGHVRQNPLFMIGYSASLAAFMVATAILPGIGQRLFGNSQIRWLAEISYGAYLSHALIIYILFWKLELGFDWDAGNFLIVFVTTLVGATIYGYLSARYYEQPIRRWARRFGRSQA